LEYVLKGIRRGLPAHSRPKRLPITPYILRIIHRVWSQDPVDHDKVMLWAACCLAFFGFLRCGEFTCPCLGAYSPTMLSPTDIRVDSHVNPQCLAVHLRQSKTDPFGAGVTLYLGRTGEVLCPVTSVLAYLAIHQATPGPLFIFRDGTPLSRTHFVAVHLQYGVEFVAIEDDERCLARPAARRRPNGPVPFEGDNLAHVKSLPELSSYRHEACHARRRRDKAGSTARADPLRSTERF